MIIERVLKLFGKSFDLQLLSKELLVQVDNFVLEALDLSSFASHNTEFAFQVTNLVLEQLDIFKTFIVLLFTLRKSSLENLNLLVEQSKLIIAANKLGTENITLVDHIEVLFATCFVLLLSLSKHVLVLHLLVFSRLLIVYKSIELGLAMSEFSLVPVVSFLVLAHQMIFGSQSNIFGFNFVLQLLDLMSSNLKLTTEFSDLIL
jgi:hypothetical protein